MILSHFRKNERYGDDLSNKFKKCYRIVRSFFDGLSARNVGVYASSAAFYIFLSIVPFIMLVCSFLPVSRLESRELVEFISLVVPETVTALIEEIINEVYDSSAAVLSISAITTLWSASKALASIMRGIEHVSTETHRDKYIKLRLKAMLYSALMILAIYVHMLGTVLLNVLVSKNAFVSRFNRVLSPILFALVLTIAYKYTPDKRLPIKNLLPGACAASLTWMIFTNAYSVWLRHSNGFGIYGNLGSVIITLLWMFFSVYIMLSGAYFNRFLIQVMKKYKKNKG